jgi:sporulation protein YlmC with PRC-barrel domain
MIEEGIIMLRSAKQIKGLKIAAEDGEIGKVDDFLFDDREWIIRYMVADTGTWLIDRLVLISPVSLRHPNTDDKVFPVKLTKKQVEKSPGIDTHKPVSRQHENDLVNYYQWPAYWYPGAGYSLSPMEGYIGAVPVIPDDNEIKAGTQKEEGDPHLRSIDEVAGYNVQAKDDGIGHIEDFIIDDDKWNIRYAVIDTSNWLPGSRKVLISPQWIKKISWSASEVKIDLAADKIKNSPEFDTIDKINRHYEEQLYNYYEYPKYW